MRVSALLLCFLLLVTGCGQKENTGPRKQVPVTIRVTDLQGQPVSRAVVGITAVIPEELRGKVGAIPMAVYADEHGQVVQMLSVDSEYEISCGDRKMKVKVGNHPVSVECVSLMKAR